MPEISLKKISLQHEIVSKKKKIKNKLDGKTNIEIKFSTP